MWLIESNRPKHILSGIAVYALWMIVPSLRGDDFDMAALRALLVVAIAMMCVEFGQRTAGSRFDWLDILAGCLIPLIATIIILMIKAYV